MGVPRVSELPEAPLPPHHRNQLPQPEYAWTRLNVRTVAPWWPQPHPDMPWSVWRKLQVGVTPTLPAMPAGSVKVGGL